MRIYKCDGHDCSKTTDDMDSDWLEISTKNNGLYLRNNLPNRRLMKMGNHSDIHFCSKECIINALFTK